jgi:hypothetical protein
MKYKNNYDVIINVEKNLKTKLDIRKNGMKSFETLSTHGNDIINLLLLLEIMFWFSSFLCI